MLQGAIDSTSRKRTLPLKSDVRKESPSSNSTLKDNVNARRQANSKKKIQKRVTSYFNELKNRACLSAEKHPSDKINADAASKQFDLVEQLKVSKREVNRNPSSLNKSDLEHSEKPRYGKRPCLNEVKSSVANSSIAPMLNRPLSMGIGHKAEMERHFSPIGKPTLYSENHNKRAEPSSGERCNKLEGTNMQQATKSEQSHVNQDQSNHCDMIPSIVSSSPTVLNQGQSSRHDRAPSIDSSSPCVLNQSPLSHHNKVPSIASSSPRALKLDQASIVRKDLATSQSCIKNISSSKDTNIAKKISENVASIRQRIARKRQRNDVDMGIPCQSTDSVFNSNVKQSYLVGEDPPKKQNLSSGSKVIYEVQNLCIYLFFS